METEVTKSPLEAFSASQQPPAFAAPVPYSQPQILAPMRPVGAQKVAVYRDEERVFQKLAALAARAGDGWGYRFPVKNRKAGTSSFVEGPSIKLANDLVRVYGNCEVSVEVRDVGTHWLFNATLIDFESGTVSNRWYQQRKAQGSIGGDADRQMDIAFQIGQSKAIRNVVVNALQTFADFAFEQARENLVKKVGENIERFRARVLDRLAEMNVAPGRAAAVVGRSPNDWLAPDIAQLISMIKAISDGMASIDDSFPPIGEKHSAPADDRNPTARQTVAAADFAAGGPQEATGAPAAEEATDTAPSEKTAPAPAGAAAAAEESEFLKSALAAGHAAGVKGMTADAMQKRFSSSEAGRAAWLAGHQKGLAERDAEQRRNAEEINDVMGG